MMVRLSSLDEGILKVVEGYQEYETHNLDMRAVTHKRGHTPFVFIPFVEVHIIFDLDFALSFIVQKFVLLLENQSYTLVGRT